MIMNWDDQETQLCWDFISNETKVMSGPGLDVGTNLRYLGGGVGLIDSASERNSTALSGT